MSFWYKLYMVAMFCIFSVVVGQGISWWYVLVHGDSWAIIGACLSGGS